MSLCVGVFPAEEVRDSAADGWKSGRLDIHVDGLRRRILKHLNLKGVDLDLVVRDESARVINVLDVIRPQIKASGAPCFPGFLSPTNSGGEGTTHVLEGVLVVVCAKVEGANPLFTPKGGLIDMVGPGVNFSPFSRSHLIVLTLALKDGLQYDEIADCLRMAGLQAATAVAGATIGRTPSNTKNMDSSPRGKNLPSVGVVMQLSGEGELHDTYIAGHSAIGILPTFARYERLMDGLVVGNNFTHACQRNFTCMYQENPLMDQLCHMNGETISLAGLVLTREFSQSSASKQRMASMAADLMQRLGARGVVVTTDGAGNAHVDTILTCQECEKRGMHTVILLNEMSDKEGRDPGLVDFVPEANAIVSTGNREAMVDLPAVQRVVGGAPVLEGDVPASGAIQVPIRTICGSTNEMGAWRIGAEAF